MWKAVSFSCDKKYMVHQITKALVWSNNLSYFLFIFVCYFHEKKQSFQYDYLIDNIMLNISETNVQGFIHVDFRVW